MGKFYKPKEPGWVHPGTGRVAVLASDYADSDFNGEGVAYWYNEDADVMGYECWTMIDGIDPHVSGGSWDVWFVHGAYKTVGPAMTIFVTKKVAEELAKAKHNN